MRLLWPSLLTNFFLYDHRFSGRISNLSDAFFQSGQFVSQESTFKFRDKRFRYRYLPQALHENYK